MQLAHHGGVPQSENKHPNLYHMMFFQKYRVLKQITEIQFIFEVVDPLQQNY